MPPSSSPSSSIALEPPSPSSAPAESELLLTKPFVLLLCVQFCFGIAFSVFFLLPKYLAREFHASSAVIGAVAAISLLAGVAATPLLGAVIDRGARRPAIFYGALLNALCAAAFAAVHTISLGFYLLRAVQGVSYALVFNAIVTIAADLAPPKKLSQAIGLCGAAGMVANSIAPATAEIIADQRGWGLVFLLAAAAALLAALLSLGIREPRSTSHSLTPASPANTAGTASPANTAGTSALALIADPKRTGAFLCVAAAGAAFGALFTFTQPLALSLGASKVSGFFLGYTLCALSVRLFLGSLADNVGRERVAFAALVLYGLDACMTTALRPSLLIALGAGLGLAHGLLYPALNAIAAEGVPRARRGAVMSYFSACFYGGFAVWVYGLGWLAKATGYELVFLLSGLLVWGSLFCLPRRDKGLQA